MNLNIGKSQNGRKFTIPADLVTEVTAILGRRGSGKTTTGVVMAEELIRAGEQVVILDPLGVWIGMRSSADGKKAGLPVVILGGQDGDLPLDATNGHAVAEFLVEHGISAVLDLSFISSTDRKQSSKAAQLRFVADFCERLYEVKSLRANRSPIHLIIDEADAFVPQNVHGEKARSKGAIDTLVRRARTFGIGVTLISQRPAVVNKDVLTQAEVLIAHQTTGTQDRKALKAWIEANAKDGREAEFIKSIASLNTGEAWVWSPAWLNCFERVQVRPRSTFDAGTTPSRRGKRKEPKKRAEVDLAGLKNLLSETIEKKKESDPRELRKRIAELEARRPEIDSGAIDRAIAAREAELEKVFEVEREKYVGIIRRMDDGLAKIARATSDTGAISYPMPERVDTPPRTSPIIDSPSPRNPKPSPAQTSDTHLGKAARTIIELLVGYPGGVTRKKLGFLSGYVSHKSTFRGALTELTAAGFIEKQGLILSPSADALAEIPLPKAPGSGDEMKHHYASKIGAAARAILDVLFDQGNKYVDRHAVGEMSGYSSGVSTFRGAMTELNTLGLLDKRGSEIKLIEEFFV